MQTYAALSVHWSWGVATWCADTAELAARTGRYLLFGTLSSAVVQDYLALCLLSGGTAVIPALPAPGEGPLFPGVFQRLRATATIMTVPRMYQMLDSLREDDFDLSTVGAIMVAGSPLPAHRLAEAADAARASGVLLVRPDRDRWPDLAHPQGHRGRRARVGRAAAARGGRDVRDGEILVRSPYQMCGYLDEPELTAEVLVDGWVRTRDLGMLDKGYLYLTGRAREVIIVDALPVYAGPIERTLTAHDDVDQAYVVGALDDRRGEAVHAFVVRPGRPAARPRRAARGRARRPRRAERAGDDHRTDRGTGGGQWETGQGSAAAIHRLEVGSGCSQRPSPGWEQTRDRVRRPAGGSG